MKQFQQQISQLSEKHVVEQVLGTSVPGNSVGTGGVTPPIQLWGLTLDSLTCNTTEDTTGPDEPVLYLDVDDISVPIGLTPAMAPLNGQLNDGQTWQITKTIPFRSRVRVRLVDADFGSTPVVGSIDADDDLGSILISGSPEAHGRGAFDRDGASYTLTYSVAPYVPELPDPAPIGDKLPTTPDDVVEALKRENAQLQQAIEELRHRVSELTPGPASAAASGSLQIDFSSLIASLGGIQSSLGFLGGIGAGLLSGIAGLQGPLASLGASTSATSSLLEAVLSQAALSQGGLNGAARANGTTATHQSTRPQS
jgi:hypothetical protein